MLNNLIIYQLLIFVSEIIVGHKKERRKEIMKARKAGRKREGTQMES